MESGLEELYQLTAHFGGFISNLLICIGAAIGIIKVYFVTKDSHREDVEKMESRIEATKKEVLDIMAKKEDLRRVEQEQQEQDRRISELMQLVERQLAKLETMANIKTEIGDLIKELKADFNMKMDELKADIKADITDIKNTQASMSEANLEIQLQLKENQTKIENLANKKCEYHSHE